jgi:Ca2+-binding RTX toxin-like protein
MWHHGRKRRQSGNRLSANRPAAGRVETLETRRLLSASASLAATGVLNVVGTTGNDTIEIAQSGGNVGVSLNGSLLNVTRGRKSLGTSVNTTANPIKRISVQGLAGNDAIIYDASVTIPGAIVDGNGSDQITSPGTANLTVRAGGGDDIVTLGDGNYLVALGDGNDQVTVGNGNSMIGTNARTGDDNVDNFTVGNGNNTVTYHGGIDNVILGTGNDSIKASGDAVSGITVSGGSGADFIDNPYSGNIDLVGSSGNDVVRIGGSTVLDLGSGNDLALAEGKANFDYITGGSGSDIIVALQGNDTIDGTAGNGDVLISRRSTNTVSGSSTSTIYGPATLGGNNAATYVPVTPKNIQRKLAAWEAET